MNAPDIYLHVIVCLDLISDQHEPGWMALHGHEEEDGGDDDDGGRQSAFSSNPKLSSFNPHSRPHARPYIDGRNEPINPSDHHHHHHPPHPHPRFFCSAPLNPTKPRFVRLPRAVFGTGFHALIGGRRGHVERLMWSLNGVE